ncbi:MAG: putative Ig domain-containing protein [Myxococcota bacterium]
MDAPRTHAALLASLLALVGAGIAGPAIAAPGDGCSGDHYVDETFPSGARWQLCWEHRNLEGIVFYDVYYTPPGGSLRPVLAEAHIAQIHVPYDDNGARFHDVTDYAIGGSNMDDLAPSDCPGGVLLQDSGKDVVCKQLEDRDFAYRQGGQFARDRVLKLFSVTHVGAYNYIPEWRFHADGTIAPTIGATGRLQRFGNNGNYGWPIRSGSTTGIAHIHNYHWRLDFQFDEASPSEVVEEIDHVRVGSTREKQVTALTTEASRSVDLETRRSWRVRDGAATNGAGAAISYHIEPSHHSHEHTGPSYEPWTENDLYVTRYSACERYASHNDNVGGCGDNLTDFVDGESVFEEDVVVWYSMTFHHLPTDEDEPHMHSHWDGFEIVPRDWSAENPLPQAPALSLPAETTSYEGVAEDVQPDVVNPEGATLTFSAEGLPDGLSIDPGTGAITGTPAVGSAGAYPVAVRALGEVGGVAGWIGDAVTIDWTVAALTPCEDGLDNDADGHVDGDDPGCTGADDTSEKSLDIECDDGEDNDLDGHIDLDDPGCPIPFATTEMPACDDTLDNDGDGLVDFADPQCTELAVGREGKGCGLGFEAALVAPLLAWRLRRRKASA